MIDKANAQSGLSITHDNRGANKPATSISWLEAAQFVNWLNLDSGSMPAYKFNGSSFELWQPGDAGYNPNNLYRNSQAKYVLPSVDEWYKAAYYDPNAGVYYDYPTGSDSVPDEIDFAGDTTFDVVYGNGIAFPAPNDITNVGVLSPYGTAGQGGNVFEWEETDLDLVNDSTSSLRGFRGGGWVNPPAHMLSSSRFNTLPFIEGFAIGFRVASIPEPSSQLPGDFNGDGMVNDADYTAWGDTFGSTTDLAADGNGNGVIDAADYTVWRDNFAAASVAVPEPTGLLLTLLGVASCGWCGRRR